MSRIFKGLLLGVVALVALLALVMYANTPNPIKSDQAVRPSGRHWPSTSGYRPIR
ncbi:MAG TPA: hypothetical protein VN303_02940 [Pseudomonas sp.]|nr:hypothetical protein [Pseudomonas sp.]